jgi:hypothetical protein
VAEPHRPFRASYLFYGPAPEKIFAALLEVQRFPEWALGLRRARILQGVTGTNPPEVRPGATLEFVLTAAGLTHRVASTVTVVEPPRRLEWRYVEGATGSGGWLLEDAGVRSVRLTLSTDYRVRPDWLDRLAHRPFFRGITEDLLRRSLRRFENHLRES